MKKYILMAVAGMLALSSCSNDDNDELNVKNAPRKMTFTAGFGEAALTRATLDPTTKKVSFDADDRISIFSANTNNSVFATAAGGASASFEGMAAIGDPKYYAVYPSAAALTFNNSTGVISGVEISLYQAGALTSACGWDPNYAIAYATTTGSSLTFKNACALLKVTNGKSKNATLAVIDVTNTAKLTGTFDLDTSTGALTATSPSFNQALVFDVPANKTVYIAVAPFTTTHLATFWQASGDETPGGYKHKTGSVTFEAGKIYDLGNSSDWNQGYNINP